jgi:hypothetical protein
VTATAIIYVPAYHRDDSLYLRECESLATLARLYTIPIRDVAVVDHLLNVGWADLVLVALPHHAIVGWPVRVASDVQDRAGATVVDLPPPGCRGRNRALGDNQMGRVVRHPTSEMPPRQPRTSAQALIDTRVRRWAAQFPWSPTTGTG